MVTTVAPKRPLAHARNTQRESRRARVVRRPVFRSLPRRARLTAWLRAAQRAALGACAALVCAGAAQAEVRTLEEALERANRDNPALFALREEVAANNELLSESVGAFMPRLSASESVGRTDRRTRQGPLTDQTQEPTYTCEVRVGGRLQQFGRSTMPDTDGSRQDCEANNGRIVPLVPTDIIYDEGYYDSRTHSLSFGFNLFRSGADRARYEAARENVRLGQARYRSQEQTTLLQAVEAYLQVRYTRRTIDYRRSNLEALQERLRVTERQFAVRDKTRADLEQVNARVAVAMADLARVQSDSSRAEASFVRVVGVPPGATLEAAAPPAAEHRAPEALAAEALRRHPTAQSAHAQWRIAVRQRAQTLAQAGPSLDFSANYQDYYENDDSSRFYRNTRSRTKTAALQLTIPIYQGGVVGASTRRAERTAQQRRQEYENQLRLVREAVVHAWHTYNAARARAEALAEAVRAAEVALEHVRLEVGVGQRLVVEELDASRDLVNNQVAFEAAQRDVQLAAYQLRASVGDMTATSLGLSDLMPAAGPGFTPDLLVPDVFEFVRHRDAVGIGFGRGAAGEQEE